MTTKIAAGAVVTANGRMDVWQPGYVVVRDSRIVEAGPGMGPAGDFDESIDAASSIVMPGLVNGHSHSPSNLLKGTWSRLPLEIWRRYSAPAGANTPVKPSMSARSSASSR